jgi:hypothetical protein
VHVLNSSANFPVDQFMMKVGIKFLFHERDGLNDDKIVELRFLVSRNIFFTGTAAFSTFSCVVRESRQQKSEAQAQIEDDKRAVQHCTHHNNRTVYGTMMMSFLAVSVYYRFPSAETEIPHRLASAS